MLRGEVVNVLLCGCRTRMRFDILRCLVLRQIQKYIQTGRKVTGSDGDDTYVIDILEELF